MDLTQLTHFVEVASQQNFTRAAERIGLSQPALSRSIGKLEEELGQPVFERQARQVTLTDAGRLLLPRAKRILALVEDTKAEITDDGQTGRVRLAAIPTIAPYLLPEVLTPFATAYPDASISVQEDTTDLLLRSLRQGDVDLALMASPIEDKSLTTEPLFEEDLLIVLPTEHPLAAQDRIALAELEIEPFVLLGEAHCLTAQIVNFCRDRSFQPVSIERTSQLATVQELVALGHGVSLVPAMARERDDSPRRVYRSVCDRRLTRTVVMVWNPYRFQSRLFRAFLAHVRSITAHRRRPIVERPC